MDDLISLDEVRRARRPSYIDRESIEAACAMLEANVIDITKGSHDAFGGIDPIAYEINAHLVAIRRAIETQLDNGEQS